MRTRDFRRYQMFRIQRKRFNKVKRQFQDWLNEGEDYRWASFWQGERRPIDPGFFEKLRWSHYGCGCKACKPWKHFRGKQFDYKVSERRQIQGDRYGY